MAKKKRKQFHEGKSFLNENVLLNREDQAAFIRHIEEAPDDQFRRDVYADWLEERGQDDEAGRQRKYEKAKSWLREFVKNWNLCGDYNKDWSLQEGNLDKVINIAVKKKEGPWYETGNYFLAVGSDIHSPDELGEDLHLFWENMEIVTGMKFDSEHRDKTGWSCTC